MTNLDEKIKKIKPKGTTHIQIVENKDSLSILFFNGDSIWNGKRWAHRSTRGLSNIYPIGESFVDEIIRDAIRV